MKILWQAHEGNLSGANIALLEYIDALKNEHKFHVILPHEGNMLLELRKRNVSVCVVYQYGWTLLIPKWKIGKWIKVLIRSFIALKQVSRIIKKENIDFIFTNTLVPFVASISAKLTRKPHIWWIHEFGDEDFGFHIGFGNSKRGFKWMQRSSKLIICNSEAVSKKFRNLMPTSNIQRLYQPISWNMRNLKEKEKKGKYLMFGQIAPSKGHMEVLAALAAIKKEGKINYLPLHIVGPCDNRNYLIKLNQFIYQNDLKDWVTINSGFFNKVEVIPFFEVLIVASKSEAFGRVIVEANKAGLKVIVNNKGGSPELVNESNGLLYNNQYELESILAGNKSLPVGEIRLNYDEDRELEKLRPWLMRLQNGK